MTFQPRISAIALGLLLGGLLVAAPVRAEDRSGPRTTVVRGDHVSIAFWANQSWSSRTLSGTLRAGTLSKQDQPGASLPRIPLSLYRVRGAEHLRLAEQEKVLHMNLSDLVEFAADERNGLTLQRVASVTTGPTGEFEFPDLAAGIYSLQIDWDRVGTLQAIEVDERRPSRTLPSLSAFLATRGYQPEGQ